MTDKEDFHDLLFEMSNKHRYQILLMLQEKSMRLTDITRKLDLTTAEVRRHVTRLNETNLIHRDLDGNYHPTPYGEACLVLFQEFLFISDNKDYFTTHTLSELPTFYVNQIGELQKAEPLTNIIYFFRQIEKLINESNDFLWLLVDQFPINSLPSIIDAIERGVNIRIIEPVERVLNPDLNFLSIDETNSLNRARHTSLVEQRMLDEPGVFLYLSENGCLLSFPTLDGNNDYSGFIASDEASLKWSSELFQYYWKQANERTSSISSESVRQEIYDKSESKGQVVVEGKDNAKVDAQAVQDAVDKFDEVILRGTFNFGTSYVKISRSVIIRGEGRENDIPSTIVYKKGWSFPFIEFDYVFLVDGEEADVTIENIHFTDFNCSCIRGWRGKRINVKNNRISLWTGYGRGVSIAAFGDIVMPISIESIMENSFEDGVYVEGNKINFRSHGIMGGHISRGGLEDDPEYRPDLFNHEYYIGIGIVVNGMSGLVRIVNNTIKNANSRGIQSSGHRLSAFVQIKNNLIESDVYGSYYFSHDEAGAGIVSYSARAAPGQGFGLEIEDNRISLDKINYSGILAMGPIADIEGSDKLRGGIIRNNFIHLKDGFEGIHVRMCDDFEVENNVISGMAYYGIKVSGQQKDEQQDLRALNNCVKENDMSNLLIRSPDKYSDNHIDGRMFSGFEGKSITSHVWLNPYSEENIVEVKSNEIVIDEGSDNWIKRTCS